MKVLITGIAGSGKTTIISELKKSGYSAIDLDGSGVCTWINKKSGKEAVYKEGAGREWIEEHRWQVVTPRLIDLLKTYSDNEHVFIGGKIARIQVKEIYEIFDIVYLLKPDDSVIDNRLSSRTSNISNFAKKESERLAIIKNRHEFEKACLEAGAILVNNNGTIKDVISQVISGI
ncbi:MAG: hypothetical protein WCT02_01145 [Candidatus Paceibacterota bacterium]